MSKRPPFTGGPSSSSRATRSEAAKRHKTLTSLSDLGVSESKLLKILKKVQEQPDVLDIALTRESLHAANEDLLSQVADVVQLPLADGGHFNWECCNLGKLIDVFSFECEAFSDVVQELYAKLPCTPINPWSLIVYADETIPGDPLRLDHLRKFMAVYVSLKEFGPMLLKHEKVWMLVVILRTSIIKKIDGKWSGCVRAWLRKLLLAEGNVKDGVSLRTLKGNLMFLKIGNLLGDEEALRATLCHKGASGAMPCVQCLNVTGTGPKSILRENEDFFVDLTCIDLKAFRHRTDQELWDNADTLERLQPLLSVKAFDEKEQGFGLNYVKEGLLWDRELRPFVRPISILTHDPTHTMYAKGIVVNEIDLLIPLLHGAGCA